ncbi:ATP-binding protein [Sutcliffiella sp. NPDC057660]|uniref:ATP-binding protein n=1 Tax=Sutcliffiella sp. NPDC057660 TaxID=3346199 RepID=UPI0036A96974
MLKIRDKRPSLLRYWTTRYFITLMIGLIVIAFLSVLWIKHSALENRLNMTIFMAEEIASRVSNYEQGRFIPRDNTPMFKDPEHRTNGVIYIVDKDGTILSANRSIRQSFKGTLPQNLLNNEEQVQKIADGNKIQEYLVKAPIEINREIVGWVVIIQPENELVEVKQEYSLLFIMLGSLAILGWAAIYFLSRKLSSPIKEVAIAAKQVQEGNYTFQLPENLHEEETYELVESFREMADRLQQLESLRTELLAGVTHELKTPVTSISGLLQAVRDDVVTGIDAKEFIAISLKETFRMQKMIADLLDFNSFSVNQLSIINEHHFINRVVAETAYQWKHSQQDNFVELKICLLEEDEQIETDAMRLKQVLFNLLNNAKQAIVKEGMVTLSMKKEFDHLSITIQDTGCGIPIEEQSLIFERFYRGDNKKFKLRGLGIGLPFSKMIAHALGGELILVESSTKGSTFKVSLPLIGNNENP